MRSVHRRRKTKRMDHGCLITIGLALGLGVVCGSLGMADEPPAASWQMVWHDEFDGQAIDPGKWDYDVGNGFFNSDAEQWISGWGNGEMQYYTRAPDNAIVRDGLLHLRALKQSMHGCGYTSARLKTRHRDGHALLAQTYGRFEIRAKLPTGQGLWPALWMLPLDEKYGGWASSGEIDIMEARGQHPAQVLGTIHYGSRWPANQHTGQTYVLPDGGTIADFHVYAVQWEPGVIRWFVDGREFSVRSFWWSSSRTRDGKGAMPANESDLNPWPAPFDQPFYLIMNLAVGGQFVGKPNPQTPFPAEMLVDYVRVYQKIGGYDPVPPRGEGKLPFDKP